MGMQGRENPLPDGLYHATVLVEKLHQVHFRSGRDTCDVMEGLLRNSCPKLNASNEHGERDIVRAS